VFDNRALRRIFGTKREEATGEWRRLRNILLTKHYSDDQSRRMGWTGHVARMGARRVAFRILVRKVQGRGHSEDFGVDEKIILKWIFKQWSWMGVGTGLVWLRRGRGGGLL
jgi:hypothetical protein